MVARYSHRHTVNVGVIHEPYVEMNMEDQTSLWNTHRWFGLKKVQSNSEKEMNIVTCLPVEARTYLAVQVGLSWFWRVQLQTLPYALSQHVTGRVRFHDLCHSLLNQGLHSREPISVGWPQVIGQIHADHDTRRRRVNTHRIRHLSYNKRCETGAEKDLT